VARQPRPEPRLAFEFRVLADGRGYIRFNLFAGDLAARFRKALEELRDTGELVLDLRGNRGGAGNLAAALANELCARPGSLGQMKFRSNATPMAYPGRGENAYAGRVTVWTDEWTGSTAEILARGLQTNRGARVIGSVTAGAVLPSIVRELPSGGLLQYPIANYLDARGEPLEGRGVKPDVTVRWSLADLRSGRDAWREAAAAR
jgi:carboxyl-terminal processing protease